MSRLLTLLLIIVCFLSCNRHGKQKDAATDVAEYNLKGKTISMKLTKQRLYHLPFNSLTT